MMTILTSQISLLLLLLLSLTTFHGSLSSNNHTMVRCNEKDRETLLIFKEGIIDRFGRLSTWATEKDCCAWEGVSCDNITNRVTKLDLKLPPYFDEHEQLKTLKGEINKCILELEFLSYLDLSNNEFDVISFTTIQHNITHASNLLYLDLSSPFRVTLHMDNLYWLSPLSSLKYLNLSGIDLHKVTNWLQAVNTLPSLLELQLSDCKLNNFIINPFIQYSNLSSLLTLDLSYNNFTSQLPNWFFNLTKDVTYLDLSSSKIHGEIPSSLLNLRNLRHLDLSRNQLKGSIPDGIGQLAHIQYLDLSLNLLSGSIPSTLQNLSSLYSLYIGSNNFTSEISKTTFSNLRSLRILDLSNSTFVFQFDLEWNPPFQLNYLSLSNTNQGPNFPSWIYTQKSLETLDLSSSRISSVDRNKFPSLIEGIPNLSLSNNSITEDISNLTLKCFTLELDHNNFTGGLPNISPMAIVVDLSYNSFSGSIPHSWKNLEDLFYINLPECVYNLTHMVSFNYVVTWTSATIKLFQKGRDYVYEVRPDRRTIDLSVNSLSGEVPLELFRLVQVQTLNLSHNNFIGTIPKTIGGMKNMESLDLSNNKFRGEIPQSMSLLNFLGYLNLSCNNFNGKIPIGTQIQSFDASSYSGNPKLCGEPLNNCTTEEENHKNATSSTKNEDDDSMRESLYLGMGVGFAVGFWGICGSLFLIRKWRHAYYRFVDGVGDKLYVALMVKLNSFHRN